jgi:hypothetical protein
MPALGDLHAVVDDEAVSTVENNLANVWWRSGWRRKGANRNDGCDRRGREAPKSRQPWSDCVVSAVLPVTEPRLQLRVILKPCAAEPIAPSLAPDEARYHGHRDKPDSSKERCSRCSSSGELNPRHAMVVHGQAFTPRSHVDETRGRGAEAIIVRPTT